jgi:hypothetical protein
MDETTYLDSETSQQNMIKEGYLFKWFREFCVSPEVKNGREVE